MIIEQAFMSMPEIMVGNGYVEQEHESGIVSSFSLAILQELNGRNLQNPISCIRAEEVFRDSNTGKHNRIDLLIDLEKLNVSSHRLLNYGFRHKNFLEAKFFRGESEQINSSQNIKRIITDIYKLAILPTKLEENNKPSSIGRYFLHVYKGRVNDYFSNKYTWLSDKIASEGVKDLEIELDDKDINSNTFLHLPKLSIKLTVTNIILKHNEINSDNYIFILSRFETLEIKYNKNEQNSIFLLKNGKIDSLNSNEFNKIYSAFFQKQDDSKNIIKLKRDKQDIFDKIKLVLPRDAINQCKEIIKNKEKRKRHNYKKYVEACIKDIKFLDNCKKEYEKIKSELLKENIIDILSLSGDDNELIREISKKFARDFNDETKTQSASNLDGLIKKNYHNFEKRLAQEFYDQFFKEYLDNNP